MTSSYQPFPIMELKTGINNYLQPWISPMDAFDPLKNAYVYRGILSKRAGYSQWGDQLEDENPVMGIMRYQDQSNGDVYLLIASTQNLYLYDDGSSTFSSLTTDLFTGNISNFFNYCNWQASQGATSYIYMANGVDPVTTYDGSSVAQPTLTVQSGVTITTALDVKIYKNRLLVIRPTLSTGGDQNQSIYWSAINNPLGSDSFRSDIQGNGGYLAAPTGDMIQSAKFVRDSLIVFFTNSVWSFRYTGNDFQPFRWYLISDSKSTSCPYASVQYDERVTSIGRTGIIACDGVNVQRFDTAIIDYYENNLWPKYYNQSFSQRYDNLNQTWTLYVSKQNNFSPVGAVAPGSDAALVYNFLENTWCSYEFQIPLTCLGLYYTQTDQTWADFTTLAWQDADFPWDNYNIESDIPILLAGDTSGNVWWMDNSSQVTDKDTDGSDLTISWDVKSTRWNPFIQTGQKAQFGYIDFYYYVSSVNASDEVTVILNFYVDNSNNAAISRTLTLDGPTYPVTAQISTGTGASSYSGTLTSNGNVVPETFNVSVTTSAGDEDFTDTGSGALVGSLGSSGTIDYMTGDWTLDFGSETVASGEAIEATYEYYLPGSSNFKRIYINLTGQFLQMEIDPDYNTLIQFYGFILWARPSGRLTPF